MEIIDINTAELVIDPNNLRQHGSENIEMIKKSLSEYGQYKPLIVDKDTLTVLIGNGRLTAMRELGWKTCKCILVDRKQFSGIDILDNRLNELSAWKDDTLQSWLLDDKGVEWWGVDIETSLKLLNKAKKEAKRKKDNKPEKKTNSARKEKKVLKCPCCGKELKKTKPILF